MYLLSESEQKQEEKKKELLSFLGILIDEIDFQKRIQEDVAKEIGISSGSLSRNLTAKNQFNFWSLIKLLNLLYENDVVKKRKMLHKFCSVTTSKKNLRIAMEYANAVGDLILLKQVVYQEKCSTLPLNREWAYVYELVWMRASCVIQGSELLNQLETRKKSKVIKSNEMNALYDILNSYTMYGLGKFNSFFDYVLLLKPKVDKITDDFIRKMYEIRMKEALACAHLMQDDTDECRRICLEILAEEDKEGCLSILKASAHAYLAESYTFECYATSSEYINKAIDVLKTSYFERAKKREEYILNTYSFIKMVNRCDLDTIKPFHPAEESFLEFLKGNNEKAIEILNELKKKNGSLTPIEYCYLGLAMNDKGLIETSIALFEGAGNRFYAKFAKECWNNFIKLV
ncbi:AimR family lysis-lysogeny pheromone receptor [Bacillus toyonensis]|uniref:AimR family lysis-lysogeny pheromone receptor n=1 Tax=Bacillus toyonensis TaxID=155322 RepID=UPI001C0B8A50|nr:AimR family lysis-lysogeny pheromone receptor [Bacillus toyonensis]MBU4643122.1 hypothetical protein [Bacillus toyonensis]